MSTREAKQIFFVEHPTSPIQSPGDERALADQHDDGQKSGNALQVELINRIHEGKTKQPLIRGIYSSSARGRRRCQTLAGIPAAASAAKAAAKAARKKILWEER